MRAVSLSWILAHYRPGSQGDDWTWEDEERALLSMPCRCTAFIDGEGMSAEGPACPIAGHYQLTLEQHLRAQGRIDQPILLGSDGRIWDGHHRITAARRLGFDAIPVER